jgi:hypothetical protein
MAMPIDFVGVYTQKCVDYKVEAREIILRTLEAEQYVPLVWWSLGGPEEPFVRAHTHTTRVGL